MPADIGGTVGVISWTGPKRSANATLRPRRAWGRATTFSASDTSTAPKCRGYVLFIRSFPFRPIIILPMAASTVVQLEWETLYIRRIIIRHESCFSVWNFFFFWTSYCAALRRWRETAPSTIFRRSVTAEENWWPTYSFLLFYIYLFFCSRFSLIAG